MVTTTCLVVDDFFKNSPIDYNFFIHMDVLKLMLHSEYGNNRSENENILFLATLTGHERLCHIRPFEVIMNNGGYYSPAVNETEKVLFKSLNQ